MTEIIPIGTGSAVPVKERGFSCVALRRPELALLFDCGEGTQLRLLHSDVKLSRVGAILITHLHGDHFFGLMGLLATMSLLHRDTPITVVGPAGLRDLVQRMPGLLPEELTFEVDFNELEHGHGRIMVLDGKGWRISASPLDHGVPCYGYRYEEEDLVGTLDVERARQLGVRNPRDFGRLKAGETIDLEDGTVVEASAVMGPSTPGGVFSYVTDTRPCPAAVDLALDADILYHEATFADELADRAEATGHSTTVDAARIALEAGAKRLLLSHFSARYRRFDELVSEARSVFPNSEAAVELSRYQLQPEAETIESN
ncbi:MAG: ribonuclease Z [Rhodothermia bacterium]|nr:ribonuclease Z [Rhodothermia bacterium]